MLTVGALALLGAGLWFGGNWWFNGRFIVSTDDAYVGAKTATLSAKLSANIAAVSVVQNQQVKAGQPWSPLDDGDWRIALDSARQERDGSRRPWRASTSQIEAGRPPSSKRRRSRSRRRPGRPAPLAD